MGKVFGSIPFMLHFKLLIIDVDWNAFVSLAATLKSHSFFFLGYLNSDTEITSYLFTAYYITETSPCAIGNFRKWLLYKCFREESFITRWGGGGSFSCGRQKFWRPPQSRWKNILDPPPPDIWQKSLWPPSPQPSPQNTTLVFFFCCFKS